MEATWHEPRVDGWTAVSACLQYRGIRMAGFLSQSRSFLVLLYIFRSPAVEPGDDVEP